MDLGVGGRGGARRRTRRRANARAAAQPTAAPQPQQAPAGNSPAAMLEMLKVLHKEGILDDAEFQAKKLLVVDNIA